MSCTMPNPNPPTNKRKGYAASICMPVDKKMKSIPARSVRFRTTSIDESSTNPDIYVSNFVLDLYFENQVDMDTSESL